LASWSLPGLPAYAGRRQDGNAARICSHAFPAADVLLLLLLRYCCCWLLCCCLHLSSSFDSMRGTAVGRVSLQ
jgi:hypothetical protein